MSGLVLLAALVAFGVFTGAAAGLLGVGGGTLMVPFLTLAAGSIVGAQFGAGMLARIDERLLKVIFGLFLVAVGVLLAVHG